MSILDKGRWVHSNKEGQISLFNRNILAYPYQMDEPISSSKGVETYFALFLNFKKLCKLASEDHDQRTHYLVSYLGIHCLPTT